MLPNCGDLWNTPIVTSLDPCILMVTQLILRLTSRFGLWVPVIIIIIIIIKLTSLAPISSENPSSVTQQNPRIRHSRDHVQCKKSSTDGWRCQEAKEDRQF